MSNSLIACFNLLVRRVCEGRKDSWREFCFASELITLPTSLLVAGVVPSQRDPFIQRNAGMRLTQSVRRERQARLTRFPVGLFSCGCSAWTGATESFWKSRWDE
jgi:hypothetical protein